MVSITTPIDSAGPFADIKMAKNIADISIGEDDINQESGLRTAIMVSLFTDRRANPDDIIEDEDHRGWWADAYSEIPGDLIGSRLWQLKRRKLTPDVLQDAKTFAMEATTWLIEDDLATALEIDTEFQDDVLMISIDIQLKNGSQYSFEFTYLLNQSSVRSA